MPSTFGGIELSKRSLFAQQTALTTTGHNIANANTKGFSRQIVHMVASRPMEAPGLSRSQSPGMIGQGVEFDAVRRVREGFLDDQYASENKFYGEWTMRREIMDKIEIMLSESGEGGLSSTMEGFWNAWQELSKEPDKVTSRTVILERAMTMTNAINHISQQLDNYASDMNENIRIKTEQINRHIATVANLNVQIFRVEGLDQNANDLRDQRDNVIDELSKMINLTVQRNPNGYNVSMGNIALVTGNTQGPPLDQNALLTAYQNKDLSSGEMYGMLLGQQQIIPYYQKHLDALVKGIVEGEMTVTLPRGAVLPEGTVLGGVTYSGPNRTLTADTIVTVKGLNELHRLGYPINGEQAKDFFTIRPGFTQMSARSVTVNPEIFANPKLVSASMRTSVVDGVERVVPGNGDLAMLISNVRNNETTFSVEGIGEAIQSDGSIDGFYRSLIGNIGVRGQEAKRQSDMQQVIVEQVDSRRQSMSGVSLDEEMSNMMKYQHAYNAAARLMTVYDELLDKVINGLGVVGR
ncbi:MAG: flagellar hook-associated protein FlgK [Paenibacillaceae bacterium]|nr:flagellar hook-associated protein FlgK [Paenibacillaceae bacterium]